MRVLRSILSFFSHDGYSVKSIPIDLARIYSLERNYRTLLEKNGINTHLRRCHFWAQMIHESNLMPIEENMNYSAARLLVVFPKHFNIITAVQYARQPEKIANKVYGGKFGNDTKNDGWNYRGRGFIQTTFKDNYKALSVATGVDYVAFPEKLLNVPDAMMAALYFWRSRKLNDLADMDDCRAITRRINGGLNGYDHRLQILNYLKVSLQ